MIIRTLIEETKTQLATFYPSTEIQSFLYLIFEHLYGWNRADLHLSLDREMTEKTMVQFKKIIQQLTEYEPIQYILGSAFFYDGLFFVNRSVLIPRPETEELVDRIIHYAKPITKSLNILDIGTGSGCLAVTLATNLVSAQVEAVDISEIALETAKKNALQNKAKVNFAKTNILEWENESYFDNKTFDIIVSNPPYVTQKEKSSMSKNVLSYEPHLALFVPDSDPLLFYKAIASFAKKQLVSGGKLYFEINEQFGNEIQILLQDSNFTQVLVIEDINGKNRMIEAIKA